MWEFMRKLERNLEIKRKKSQWYSVRFGIVSPEVLCENKKNYVNVAKKHGFKILLNTSLVIMFKTMF